ncbi:hypothetical protein MPSEU_000726500 [Mayamaea pseudoterrestris]|nr:hypothetical protein MPSEU_000726500 [Mayamaea pseudoterrestris]
MAFHITSHNRMRLIQLCAILLCFLAYSVKICDSFQYTVRSLSQLSHRRPPCCEPARNCSFRLPRYSQQRTLLTTTSQDNNEARLSPIRRAVNKFKARPGTYLLIPCIAALVGWFTNWLAVQMIFYPIQFRGIPLYIKPETPLGLIGWQGIVPCKTRPMTIAMVNMVSTHLLTVKEAFSRLDPNKVAELLAPEVPTLVQDMVNDILPMRWLKILPGLDNLKQAIVRHSTKGFIKDLTIGMQQNIDSVFNLQNCVVNQMVKDRSMLGQLFTNCGKAELEFLTNSGLWFGFALGIIQMGVALFWENPWTLSVGGGIVGMATNWLALKWIFQPVDPTKFGPFILQGQFLRRQKEVSVEFSKFFASKILTADRLWSSVLTDPATAPAFDKLFESHFQKFLHKVTRGVPLGIRSETLRLATARAVGKLPNYLPIIFPYMDETLGLEQTLRKRMIKMTSKQFERVLHPIFEEDELTLILAGAVLGFAAGLVQQGLETGAISMPNVWKPLRQNVIAFVQSPRQQSKTIVEGTCKRIRRPFQRWFGSPGLDDPDGTSNGIN